MSPTIHPRSPLDPGSEPDPKSGDKFKEVLTQFVTTYESGIKDLSKIVGRTSQTTADLFKDAKQINSSILIDNLVRFRDEMGKGINADANKIDLLTKNLNLIEQLNPTIWAQVAARGQAYKDVMAKLATSSMKGMNASELASRYSGAQRIENIAKQPQMAKQLGNAPGMVTAGFGAAIMERGLEGEMFKLQDAMQELELDATKFNLSSDQIAQRWEKINNKFAVVINASKSFNAEGDKGIAIADKEARIAKASARTGTQQLRDVLPKSMRDKMDKSSFFGKIESAEKAAASGSAQMGTGAKAASMGMEAMAGAISKIMASFGTVSIVFSAVAKFIQVLDQMRAAQGAAIPALMSGSGKMAGSYASFATTVQNSNDKLYWSLSMTNQFYPLMIQSFGAMSKAGYRLATSDKALAQENLALASSYMEIGVMGKAMGWETEQAMNKGVEAVRAFSLSGEAPKKFFKDLISWSQQANLSLDEFSDAIGGLGDWSKALGAEKGLATIKSMSEEVNSMQDNTKKMLALGSFKSLMTMDITKQAGYAMYGGRGGAGLDQYLGSKNPLGVMTSRVGEMMRDISAGLTGTEGEKKLAMASAAGQLVSPAVAQALLHAKGPLEQDELYQAITHPETMPDEKVQKLIDDAKKQYDPAVKGVELMDKSTTTLDKIYLLLENVVKRGIGHAAGRLFGWDESMLLGGATQEPESPFSITPRTGK